MGWLSGWENSKRIPIAVDSSKVDSDLTDFPVLISLSNSAGISDRDVTDVFDELTGPDSFDDDFTAANGSPLDADKWTSTSSAADIYNNKARMIINTGVGEDIAKYINARFRFIGNFDVQMDLSVDPTSTSIDYYNYLYTTHDGDNRAEARVLYFSATQSSFQGRIKSTVGAGVEYGPTVQFNDSVICKVKTVRSGSTITIYYDIGAGWVQGHQRTGCTWWGDTISVYTYIRNGTASSTFTAYHDNFKINSGTTFYDYQKYKIAVTTSNGTTQCPVEIEQLDEPNEKFVLWTKVPTIVSGTNTNLYLYYDNNQVANTNYIGTIGSTVGRTVWDSNFEAVYHMCQDPTGGADCIKDSTSNANHGTPGGGMDVNDLVDGKIGKALDFDGGDDYIDISDTDFDFAHTDNFSLSACVYSTNWDYGGAGQEVDIIGHGVVDDRYSIQLRRTAKYFKFLTDGGVNSSLQGSPILVNSTWYSVDVTYNGNTRAKKIYVDGGNKQNQTAPDENFYNAGETWVGKSDYAVDPKYFDGIIEEVRVSNITRSDAWIKTTYYSNWDNLLTFGQEQSIIQSPNTNQLLHGNPYYNSSSAGIEIYNDEISIEYAVAYITYNGGINTITIYDDLLFMGTTNSGIYALPISTVTGTNTMPPDNLTPYIYQFKDYPDITDSHVKYLHSTGDYLCCVTDSGVDHFNFGSSESYYRSYTTVSGAQKCWQTSKGRFYYTTEGALEFLYKRGITFDTATTTNNYQTSISLTSSNFDYSKVQSDGRDIRFYDLEGNKLDYYIWSWNYGATSTVWVEVTNSGTSSIEMYYGSDTATSESDADATFQLFDHFLGSSLDETKWPTVIEPGQISVSNSWVRAIGNSNYPYIQSASILNPPLVIEQYLDVNGLSGFSGYPNFQSSIRYPDDGAVWYTYGNEWHVAFDGSYEWHSGTYPFTGEGIYRAYIKSDEIQVTWISSMDESWGGTTSTDVDRALRLFRGYTGADIRIDWVRVRRYDPVSPSVSSIGAEQSNKAGLDKIEVVYTHQCDWDENNTGYTYYTSTSGNLFLPENCFINDISVTEGTSIYTTSRGPTNNLLFLATTSGVVLIEERQGNEENSRYKQYLVEA